MKTVDQINHVLVAGAGTLGLRIALRCALDGYKVTLFDISESQLESAQGLHGYLLKGLLKNQKITSAQAELVPANLSYTNDLDKAVVGVDLVSESVTEDVELKNSFYQTLTPKLAPGVILTSNTSFLMPSALVDSVREPAMFCAFHFHDVFNQVVVDVMPHATTDPRVVELLMEFGRRINQIPVHVQKETPGYLYNAMLMSILGKAAELLIDEAGSIQDIDRSFMGNFGTPAGPFGMLDQIGLDTAWHIANSQPDAASQRFAELLKSYIDQGKLGFKTGEGFYQYPKPEFAQAEFLQP
ncbi:3-hydroxyacyl-CoA dehydrogenase NAD-binding domain-containing protein [Arenicella xantha]|uniref:3-hydroxybutyryl-CoA dehydrogenase n=1 Tax=Arenicella xantha TaxID=644221 RepID=A0A395JME2_9GAMM|nr:3-hydroxyacyl-CoA dehydrogenase NAD-binding domain-containing protein [Arenicella xantha]RBP51585.1 3-hydroxybutyryl-CoA dehydrogenase [Arenicella xantha]